MTALLRGIAAVATAALLLSGCTYDYLQRSDRVGYSAGDAVRANLERETTDPSKKSMGSVTGLGKDGVGRSLYGPAGAPAAATSD